VAAVSAGKAPAVFAMTLHPQMTGDRWGTVACSCADAAGLMTTEAEARAHYNKHLLAGWRPTDATEKAAEAIGWHREDAGDGGLAAGLEAELAGWERRIRLDQATLCLEAARRASQGARSQTANSVMAALRKVRAGLKGDGE